jgi:hypothetical protein
MSHGYSQDPKFWIINPSFSPFLNTNNFLIIILPNYTDKHIKGISEIVGAKIDCIMMYTETISINFSNDKRLLQI